MDLFVVKDSFLRGSPMFSQKVAKKNRHPWFLGQFLHVFGLKDLAEMQQRGLKPAYLEAG